MGVPTKRPRPSGPERLTRPKRANFWCFCSRSTVSRCKFIQVFQSVRPGSSPGFLGCLGSTSAEIRPAACPTWDHVEEVLEVLLDARLETAPIGFIGFLLDPAWGLVLLV